MQSGISCMVELVTVSFTMKKGTEQIYMEGFNIPIINGDYTQFK